LQGVLSVLPEFSQAQGVVLFTKVLKRSIRFILEIGHQKYIFLLIFFSIFPL